MGKGCQDIWGLGFGVCAEMGFWGCGGEVDGSGEIEGFDGEDGVWELVKNLDW